MKEVFFKIIRIRDGRYLGASIWTHDEKRALHFTNLKDAKQKATHFNGVKVILEKS